MKYILTFTMGLFCLTSFSQSNTDDFYKTVKIGSQVWMAENLNVIFYQNGDSIPEIESQSQWQKCITGAYCKHEGQILYNWYAIVDSRGIAPSGYQIPNNSDWIELLSSSGGYLLEKGELKKSGFYSFDTGNRDVLTGKGSGGYSCWWSTNSYDQQFSYTCTVYTDLKAASLSRQGGYKSNGCSIRCIKKD